MARRVSRTSARRACSGPPVGGLAQRVWGGVGREHGPGTQPPCPLSTSLGPLLAPPQAGRVAGDVGTGAVAAGAIVIAGAVGPAAQQIATIAITEGVHVLIGSVLALVSGLVMITRLPQLPGARHRRSGARREAVYSLAPRV